MDCNDKMLSSTSQIIFVWAFSEGLFLQNCIFSLLFHSLKVFWYVCDPTAALQSQRDERQVNKNTDNWMPEGEEKNFGEDFLSGNQTRLNEADAFARMSAGQI